jgi:hypothetical protein
MATEAWKSFISQSVDDASLEYWIDDATIGSGDVRDHPIGADVKGVGCARLAIIRN